MNRREFLGNIATLPVIRSSLSSATGLIGSKPNDEPPGPFTTLRVVSLGCTAARSGMSIELVLRQLAIEVATTTGQPQSADEWATRSILLHRMDSKWWRDGLAVVVNFQPMNQPLRYADPEGNSTETTWWMFQLHHGIRDDGSNHLAHVVLVPFFPQGRTQKREYRCWELMNRILRHIHRGDEDCGTAFWKGLAAADANEACRILNHMSRTVA